MAPRDAPNVVLFVVDTLRADRVGAYGHDRVTTPRLDRLAEAGVLFENASSQAPWTAASMATLMTGLNPSVHGIDGGILWIGTPSEENPLPFLTQRTLSGSQLTLAEHLRRRGYATAGFVSNVYANSIFGFAQGFEIFQDDHADYSSNILERKRRAEQTNRLVLDWIAQGPREPFFLLVHYNDPHWPYAPPGDAGAAWLDAATRDPAHIERLNSKVLGGDPSAPQPDPAERDQLLALYDGEIAYADRHLGVVLDALERRRSRRSMLTVVTSDHGEEFLDHGSMSHGFTLYEEQLHVPLVFHWPGRLAARRVSGLAGLIDVTPTILELLGVEAQGVSFQGRSLVPALEGREPEARPVFAEATYSGQRRSIRTGGWKLIESREPAMLELFELAQDPEERENLASARAEDAARLGGLLGAWGDANLTARGAVSGAVPSLRLDDSTRERLEALGYIQ